MATIVAVKTVPLAEDCTFEFEDDVNTAVAVKQQLRMQLDSQELALIVGGTISYADGHVEPLLPL